MAKSGIANFPRQDVNDSVKVSDDYGLKVAQAIEAEWWSRDVGTTNYVENREEFHRRRLYARGDQDIRYYKDWFSQNGDLSYVNLDWNPVPIIPKFVDLMVNGMQDRLFHVKAQAIDPISTERKNDFIEKVKEDLATQDIIDSWATELNVDANNINPKERPGSEEELSLHMQINYKQDIEIAIEQGVKNVFNMNDIENIKRRFDDDLVCLGIGAVKHSFNESDGIKLEYVDPSDLVYSRGEEDPNFSQLYYCGEIKRVRVNELVKEFPDMSDEQLKQIIDKGANYEDYDENRYYHYESDDENTLSLMYFSWKSFMHDVHKVKKTAAGTEKAIQKTDEFQPPSDAEGDYQRVASRHEVVFEGVYVIGSRHLLKWEVAKNQVRPKSGINKVLMPYHIVSPKWYKGRIESHVDRMIPYADLIQQTHLKIQQVVQRMTPSGIYIDVDGILEVDLGNGTMQTAQDALNMYIQTGNIVGRSMTSDGDPNPGKIPIQDLPGSDLRQMAELIQYYQFNIQMIRDITGINEARDASDPDQYSLVGVQKLAAANSNVATRHIQEGSLKLCKFLASASVLRFQDVIEFHPAKEQFIGAIGRFSTEALRELNNLHLHDFGIELELDPDEEEKQLLEANIQAALAKDQILLSDAIDIRHIPNIKLANELLKFRQKEKQKADQQIQEQNIQAQSEANAQAAQATEQAKAQAEQLKSESKIQVIKAQEELAIKKLEVEAMQKKQLMQFEFELNRQLKEMEIEATKNLEAMKAQFAQEGQAAEGQAAVAAAKSVGSPPTSSTPAKGFESKKNDTLEGGNITTQQFEPR